MVNQKEWIVLLISGISFEEQMSTTETIVLIPPYTIN